MLAFDMFTTDSLRHSAKSFEAGSRLVFIKGTLPEVLHDIIPYL